MINKEKDAHPHLNAEVDREIKHNQIKQNLYLWGHCRLRNQEEAKLIELKKQQEQEKKKNEAQIEKVRGRKDMTKVVIEKKVKKRKHEDIKTDDDLGKYLEEDQWCPCTLYRYTFERIKNKFFSK